MGTPILYSTIDQQIEKLKRQKLIIEDEPFAKRVLAQYGYSNLIKSYRGPYVFSGPNGLEYRDGVTFDQITSLYILDKNLRNAVISAMLDLEEQIKALAADVLAEHFGTLTTDYLEYRKYKNKRKRKQQFTLSSIIQKLQAALTSDKDPIHHCMVMHGDVPPWILFKGVYFSTIINFIDQFRDSEQDALVDKLYDINQYGSLSRSQLRILMNDSLSVCNAYRNLAAHGGRIYNYDASYNFRETLIFNSAMAYLSGLNLLIKILEYYKYKQPYTIITSALNQELTRHCGKYPSDVTYLGQTLHINIIHQNIVYVSNKSNKYHINPHCSGITRATELELNEARSKGYQPCKRCVHTI